MRQLLLYAKLLPCHCKNTVYHCHLCSDSAAVALSIDAWTCSAIQALLACCHSSAL